MLKYITFPVLFIAILSSGCNLSDRTEKEVVLSSRAFNATEECMKGVTYYVFIPKMGTSATPAVVRADDQNGKPIPCQLNSTPERTSR